MLQDNYLLGECIVPIVTSLCVYYTCAAVSVSHYGWLSGQVAVDGFSCVTGAPPFKSQHEGETHFLGTHFGLSLFSSTTTTTITSRLSTASTPIWVRALTLPVFEGLSLFRILFLILHSSFILFFLYSILILSNKLFKLLLYLCVLPFCFCPEPLDWVITPCAINYFSEAPKAESYSWCILFFFFFLLICHFFHSCHPQQQPPPPKEKTNSTAMALNDLFQRCKCITKQCSISNSMLLIYNRIYIEWTAHI